MREIGEKGVYEHNEDDKEARRIRPGDTVIFPVEDKGKKGKEVSWPGWDRKMQLNPFVAEAIPLHDHPDSIFNAQGESLRGGEAEVPISSWEIGYGIVVRNEPSQYERGIVQAVCKIAERKYVLLEARKESVNIK